MIPNLLNWFQKQPPQLPQQPPLTVCPYAPEVLTPGLWWRKCPWSSWVAVSWEEYRTLGVVLGVGEQLVRVD